MEKRYQDKDLGSVVLRTSSKAKRYIIRVKEGTVFAVMPVGGSEKMLIGFINEHRDRLKKIVQMPVLQEKKIDTSTELQANTFRLHVYCTDRANFYMRLYEGILHIACPEATNFDDRNVQILLKDFLKKALRHEAKRILPARLETLAGKHGFTYSGLRIADTKSRWGSCSGKKNINLSISLMLLPDHLVDYVILHELCHTIEMNHSVRFWTQMNRVTDNLALSLRKELKGYTTFV